ncbi:thermonuclease family protein [Benzoatithermus flavus]|uniref:Thermonuclease family protein n=1 Tax=Benzoatithermus flavus TaxID=3108223 RepID=A0ABU8XMA7_9PROT
MPTIGAMLRVGVALALLGWPMPPDDPGAEEAAPVAAATLVGLQELRLDDGRCVRLAGVLVPPEAGPDTVLGAVLGQEVRLEPAAPPADRHGRLRAQVLGRGWLQGELVRAGLAVVDPASDVPDATLAALLALEHEARAANRGVWARGEIGPFPAGRVEAPVGRYVLVRGRVQGVTRARAFVYVNFGRDWRRDFTVRADLEDARRFARQGLDLDRLVGRELLVRGWLLEANGPMIELEHPAQIEVVE